MALRMIQKPPVVFTQYHPEQVLSPSERVSAQSCSSGKEEAVRRIWLSYGRSVLSVADPCMEANGGAEETLSLLAGDLPGVKVKSFPGFWEITRGEGTLYLSGTVDGEVFLYFFSPEKWFNRREKCRIELTDYGSGAAASFIAVVLASYRSVARYCGN